MSDFQAGKEPMDEVTRLRQQNAALRKENNHLKKENMRWKRKYRTACHDLDYAVGDAVYYKMKSACDLQGIELCEEELKELKEELRALKAGAATDGAATAGAATAGAATDGAAAAASSAPLADV